MSSASALQVVLLLGNRHAEVEWYFARDSPIDVVRGCNVVDHGRDGERAIQHDDERPKPRLLHPCCRTLTQFDGLHGCLGRISGPAVGRRVQLKVCTQGRLF